MGGCIVRMEGIVKEFPGVRALDDVRFDLRRGEVHALVGENGAGKSTLMKILGGVYRANQGRILLGDRVATIQTPTDAIRQGISIIYQEFNLAPTLSVAENMFLGKELKKGRGQFARLDRAGMYEQARKTLARLDMGDMDVGMPVCDLPVAKQQLVEIGKALLNESGVLVLDEPTAVLTERETRALFGVIDALKRQGVSMIYISHRLDEIQRICDRVTVLRDGRHVITMERTGQGFDKNEIVRHMVGRDLTDYYPSGSAEIGAEALRVEGLSKAGMFQDISFAARAGEILGLSGLIGAGRTELAKAIFGEYAPDAGRVLLDGNPVTGLSVRARTEQGITLVPEDRKREGLVLGMSLADNIALPNSDLVASRGVRSGRRVAELAGRFLRELSIRPALPNRLASEFSGGNQQKAVIAKWLAKNPKLLILDEPTRGVDVGAKAEIYALMRTLTQRGVSILFISSDMPELLGMCDRILVMFEGKMTGAFERAEFDQQAIMRAAAGIA